MTFKQWVLGKTKMSDGRVWRGTSGLAKIYRLERIAKALTELTLPMSAKKTYSKLLMNYNNISYDNYITHLMELVKYNGVSLISIDGEYVVEKAIRINIPYLKKFLTATGLDND